MFVLICVLLQLAAYVAGGLFICSGVFYTSSGSVDLGITSLILGMVFFFGGSHFFSALRKEVERQADDCGYDSYS